MTVLISEHRTVASQCDRPLKDADIHVCNRKINVIVNHNELEGAIAKSLELSAEAIMCMRSTQNK